MARRVPRIVAEGIDAIARIQVDGIKAGFISGSDVNSRKYEPSIVNRRPIRLVKSGTMERGVHVSSFTKPTGSPLQATITSGSLSKDYAEVHNEGIGNMPERQFFPTDKLVKRTQGRVNIILRNTGRKIVRSVK